MQLASRNNAIGTVIANDGLTAMKDELGTSGTFVLSVTGATGSFGQNSWNGNLGCCWPPADTGTFGFTPNDSDYLDTLVGRVIAAGWPIDPKRIYIYAQGGGGTAAAFRTACDHSSRWAAIWDYAGAGPQSADTTGGTDPTCSPSDHVSFFHLHGTADISAEPYSGQSGAPNAGMPNKDPSAIGATLGIGTMDQLKAFNGCSGALTLTTVGWDDLVTVTAGNETDLYTTAGCPSDGAVLFGAVNGEDHSFTGDAKNPNYKVRVYEFFTNHPKP